MAPEQPASSADSWLPAHQHAVHMTSSRAEAQGRERAGTPAVDREMFALMWSPTVAAVSVVLDHAEEVRLLRTRPWSL